MMRNNNAAAGGGDEPGSTRCMRFCSEIPIMSRLLLIVCIALYIDTWVDDYALYNNSIGLYNILVDGEWYRILSAPFFHSGILHLGFNMLSSFYLSNQIEKLIGSLAFTGLIMMFAIVTNLLYLFIWWCYYRFTDKFGQSSVGFSGVLFSLMMIDTGLSAGTPRSVFGLCRVPSAIYPWVLLILLQVMMSNISFVGHLSGILIGWLYTKGALNWLTMPRRWIRRFENWASDTCLSCLLSNAMYYRCPQDPPLRSIQWASTQHTYEDVMDGCGSAIGGGEHDNRFTPANFPASGVVISPGGVPAGGNRSGGASGGGGGGGGGTRQSRLVQQSQRPPQPQPEGENTTVVVVGGGGAAAGVASAPARAPPSPRSVVEPPGLGGSGVRRGEYTSLSVHDADADSASSVQPGSNEGSESDASSSAENSSLIDVRVVDSSSAASVPVSSIAMQPLAPAASAPPRAAGGQQRPISRLVFSHPRADHPKGKSTGATLPPSQQ